MLIIHTLEQLKPMNYNVIVRIIETDVLFLLLKHFKVLLCHNLYISLARGFVNFFFYIIMVLQSHNTKLKITRHRNILRVSGNEQKINITKYFFKKKRIYRYILLEYFVLDIYTK